MHSQEIVFGFISILIEIGLLPYLCRNPVAHKGQPNQVQAGTLSQHETLVTHKGQSN